MYQNYLKHILVLIGKLTILKNKPFCFINTKDGLSAICFQNDFQDDIQDGEIVIFDAISSFDKKKNRDSWKAIKIRNTQRKINKNTRESENQIGSHLNY